MPDTYHNILQPFLNYLQFEKRYSQHTITAYKTDLEQFFQFLTSQYDAPQLTEITAGFVRSWLAEMKNDKFKMGAKSLNRKISSLKSLFKYQMKMGALLQSPMTTVIAPKVSKRLPSFVAEKEMENFKRACRISWYMEGQNRPIITTRFL